MSSLRVQQTVSHVLHRPLTSPCHSPGYQISWGCMSSLANPKNNRNPWHVSKPLKWLNVVGLGMQLHSQGIFGKKFALILMHDVSHSKPLHVQLQVWFNFQEENCCINLHLCQILMFFLTHCPTAYYRFTLNSKLMIIQVWDVHHILLTVQIQIRKLRKLFLIMMKLMWGTSSVINIKRPTTHAHQCDVFYTLELHSQLKYY